MSDNKARPYIFGSWHIDGIDTIDDGQDVLRLNLEVPMAPDAEERMREAWEGLDDSGIDVWITLWAEPKRNHQEAP